MRACVSAWVTKMSNKIVPQNPEALPYRFKPNCKFFSKKTAAMSMRNLLECGSHNNRNIFQKSIFQNVLHMIYKKKIQKKISNFF